MKFLQGARRDIFVSNAFFIFVIRFFPSLANLLVISYYSRNLDRSLYGTYSNFWIDLNLLYPLACLGIQVLVFTYPATFISRIVAAIKRPQYVQYGIWFSIIAGLFALLQAGVLHNYLLPFCFIIVYTATLILEAVLMVCKRFKLLVIVNLLYSIFYWAIHRYFFGLSFSLEGLFTALLVLCVVKLFIYIIVTTRTISDKTNSADNSFLDLSKIRSLWMHLALYDIVQNYSGWIDKFIVAHTLDSAASGVYYNGSLNIPFLPLLLSAALSAVLIQLSESAHEDEVSHILALMNRTGKLLSCIVFPLFLFLLFYRYQVVILLLSNKYLSAIPVFMVALFILPLRAYSYTSILQRRHKGAIINKGAIGELLLGCALIYPLYLLFGLPGVALSFVISSYFQAGYYLYHTADTLGVRWLRLVPLSNWVIKLITFSILFYIIHYVTAHYFRELFALILGAVSTMVVIMCTLWIEMKNTTVKHGTTFTEA